MKGVSDTRWSRPTVAVDLDLTLTAEPWTSHGYIAPPAPHSRRVLRRFVDAGWQVVMYMCRTNLIPVARWTRRYFPGVISGINYNPEDMARAGFLHEKPFATIYIDDKNWPLRGGPINWLAVERDMERRGIFKHARSREALPRP